MRHLPLIGLIVLAGVGRFVLLGVSQTHVHSDEANIGLMAKHISEGRYFPFYMYGQNFNAGGAWEAYVAAAVFRLTGVGVVPLKCVIVALSLIGIWLSYVMAAGFFDRRTAFLSACLFALSPPLIKWHFQVRGYSWYFLSIPLLVILFRAIDSGRMRTPKGLFLLGLVSGLSIWSLELILPLVAAVWMLLIVRRNTTLRTLAAGGLGLFIGYAPVVLFNLTHHFVNWRDAFTARTNRDVLGLARPSVLAEIFLREMPRFFGIDTILWYHPEIPTMGWISYAVGTLAVGAAAFPFLTSPGKVLRGLRRELADDTEDGDFVLLMLLLACFATYLAANMRIPGYLLAACFFIAVLTARLLIRCFAAPAPGLRLAGAGVLSAALAAGGWAVLETGRRNEIETLISSVDRPEMHIGRIPGGDLAAVEKLLAEKRIPAVWTTVSFILPLVFETRETVAVSDQYFLGKTRRPYPSSVKWREPSLGVTKAYVVESAAHYAADIVQSCRELSGREPAVFECGALTLIIDE